MADSDVQLNLKKLQDFAKSLGKNSPYVKLGVLGAKVERTENKKVLTMSDIVNMKKKYKPLKASGKQAEKLTNAQIGLIHEFGSLKRKIPARSFLRMPIQFKLKSAMDSAGAFSEATVNKIIEEKSLLPWMAKVGVLAEGIVLQAFATGGFGRWAPWKNPNYKNNANMLLVDTTQLRSSITHEIVGGGAA